MSCPPHDLAQNPGKDGRIWLKCRNCPYTQAPGGNGKRIKPPKKPKGGGKK